MFRDLFDCIKKGDLETLLRFLPEINVNYQDENGNTPLHLATTNGHKKLVEELINHGANVNAKNLDGETALFGAARGGIIFLKYLYNC